MLMYLPRNCKRANFLTRMPVWLCAVMPCRTGDDYTSRVVVIWFPYLVV